MSGEKKVRGMIHFNRRLVCHKRFLVPLLAVLIGVLMSFSMNNTAEGAGTASVTPQGTSVPFAVIPTDSVDSVEGDCNGEGEGCHILR